MSEANSRIRSGVWRSLDEQKIDIHLQDTTNINKNKTNGILLIAGNREVPNSTIAPQNSKLTSAKN